MKSCNTYDELKAVSPVLEYDAIDVSAGIPEGDYIVESFPECVLLTVNSKTRHYQAHFGGIYIDYPGFPDFPPTGNWRPRVAEFCEIARDAVLLEGARLFAKSEVFGDVELIIPKGLEKLDTATKLKMVKTNSTAHLYAESLEAHPDVSLEYVILSFANGLRDWTGEFISQVLGSDYKVVESVEDLGEIECFTLEDSQLNEDGSYPSLLQQPGTFDSATWRGESPDRWLILFGATNNSGGTAYCIPEAIAAQCPNVELSEKLTNDIE